MDDKTSTASHRHSDRLIKNSIISFFNNGAFLVLGFVVSILTARLLGPEKYGIYNIILWFMAVVSTVVGMGLNFAITKFVSEHQGKSELETAGAIVRFVLWIEGTLALITTVVLVLFRVGIADYFFNPDYAQAFAVCIVGLVPGILTAAYSSAIEGIQKFHYFLYFSLVVTPLSLATKVVVLLNGGGLMGLLWTNLAFSIVNTLFYRWVLHREGLPVGFFGGPPNADTRSRLMRYNCSIMAIMFNDKIVHDKSENFFLAKFCPAYQAGLFNMAYGLSNKFTALIQNSFWKVLFPFMSERAGAEDHGRLHRAFFLSTRYLAFFSFPIAAGGIVLSWPLIKYALGPDYLPAQRTLQVFFVCSAIAQLATPQASVLYALNKQNFIVKYGFALALANLLLDYLVIPTYGALGAATVNGFIRITAFVGGMIYTMRITEVKLPTRSLFKILYSSILMAVLMQVVIKVNNELIGFVISIPIGLVVYLGSSMFIGTFHSEDVRVLLKVTSVFPERWRSLMLALLRSVSESKSFAREKE